MTGASAGLGRAFARLAAKDGCDLAVVARRSDRLLALAAELRTAHGVRVLPLTADLTTPGAEAAVLAAIATAGWAPPALLVNNAGFGTYAPFAATSLDDVDGMLQLNVRALTLLTRACLPAMLQAGRGAILNVASTAGFQPGPGMAVYYATKAYVLSFTEALAEELRGTGIRVTALCPGPVATEFQARAGLDSGRPMRGAKVQGAEAVAAAGMRALRRGQVVAVPGTTNQLGAMAVRLLPRSLVRRLVKWLMEQRSK
ncbi:MAG TPA: SDR family oxidoreductase [Planctomycetota bacterium]|nr:SDR family oxidoreductase [Planctomycetota bacterium]